MRDRKVLAWVKRWAPTYWRIPVLRMRVVARPGEQSDCYEVRVWLSEEETATVRLLLEENGSLTFTGVLWPDD